MIFIHEILKTFLKWRSYIGIIAIGVIVPLIEIGFKIEGGSISRMAMRWFSRDFLLFGNMFNAYFVTEFLMNSLWVHIPFLITLVAGDMLAGEATGGTFRLLLTRPVSRTRILFLKYLVALSYTAILVIFMAVLSLGLGLWLFGTGDLIVPGKITVILPASVVPMRLLLAFTLSIWSMWCVASLAFLFSSLVENAIGPIIASMAVIIVFILVSTIPLSLFESVKPFLFTTYFNFWQQAMEEPIPWDSIGRSAAIIGAYSCAMTGAAWLVFVRKDILS